MALASSSVSHSDSFSPFLSALGRSHDAVLDRAHGRVSLYGLRVGDPKPQTCPPAPKFC